MAWFPLDSISRNGKLKIYWRINSEVFANYNGLVKLKENYIFDRFLEQATVLLRSSASLNPKPLETDDERKRALG
jgi:hypothetical protein